MHFLTPAFAFDPVSMTAGRRVHTSGIAAAVRRRCCRGSGLAGAGLLKDWHQTHLLHRVAEALLVEKMVQLSGRLASAIERRPKEWLVDHAHEIQVFSGWVACRLWALRIQERASSLDRWSSAFSDQLTGGDPFAVNHI